MDSGNSGSLQSSSGGEEEYDSRADSISAFMTSTHHPTTHLGPISNPPLQPPPLPPPSPPPPQSQPLQSAFDPLSYYLRFQNPISLLNSSNMPWPKSTPPPPTLEPNNSTDHINPILSSSPSFMASFTNNSPTVPFSTGLDNHHHPTSGPPENQNQIQTQNPAAPARNPKKRSRASRRAPTTVLTTDTTNFRAMVQEFTGIPAPPFTSSSSPFPRSRLDLFGNPSSLRSSALIDSSVQPPFLLRPFAQKLSSISNNNNIITSGSFSSTSSINYQLGSQESSSISGIFPLAPNSAMLGGSKPRVSLEMAGGLNEFGLRNTSISGLPNLIPSDQMGLSKTPSNNQDLTTVNGIYSGAPSSSNFHGEKGADNGGAASATRGEGMVESWICSSE